MKNDDFNELDSKVKQIKQDFSALAIRLSEVETTLQQSSPDIIKPDSLLEKSSVVDLNQSETLSTIQDTSPKDSEANTQSSLETRIGKYWLNRLGVASLVIGVVFLVLYSFQYFGETLKLLTSLSIAIILIAFGEKLGKSKQNMWYGHGLTGGGWALVYFTVYAMYFIPDLKIIDFYPLEFSLLIAVCLGALLHAIRCQSEIIALLAVSLADLSIGLSGSSLVNNVPIFIIALLVSIVAVRQGWNALFVWLIAASYMGHAFASSEAYTYNAATSADIGAITGGFLFGFWLIFNIVMFFAPVKEKSSKALITAACINGIAFASCLSVLSQYYFIQQKNLFFTLAGLFYLLLAFSLGRYMINQLKTVNILIGLFFVNTAIWMQFSNASVVILNLLELGLLAFIGLRDDIKAFRWFAVYLSLCFFPLWITRSDWYIVNWYTLPQEDALSKLFGVHSFSTILTGVIATIVFAGVCWLYSKEEYLIHQGSFEKRFYKLFYFCFSNLSAWLVPTQISTPSTNVALWSIQPIVCAYVSIKSKEPFFSTVSLLLGLWALIVLIFSIFNWEWLPIITVITACYAFYTYLISAPQLLDWPFAKQSKTTSMIAGNIILTVLFLHKLSAFWLSSGLALEGLALVGSGFAFKDKGFRKSGLLVLALLLLKLLFVDLAKAGTLQRIISFIAAGLVFLFASYIYSEFTKKLIDSENKNSN